MESYVWVAPVSVPRTKREFWRGRRKVRDILIYSESMAKFLLLPHSNKFSLPGALCDSWSPQLDYSLLLTQ